MHKKIYFEKLKKKIPDYLIIEKVTDQEINLANDYLAKKGKDQLEFNFSPILSHFGKDWDYSKYPLGYFLKNKNDNEILGFLGTICSKRHVNNKELIFCNLVHWYVEKKYRIYAYSFFIKLLEEGNNTIINATTPRNSIIGLYEKFNFKISKLSYSVGIGFDFFSLLRKDYKRFKIISDKDKITNILNEHDLRIFYDHNFNKIHNFVILDSKKEFNYCYFVAKKNYRYKIAVLDLLYISNIKNYKIFSKIILSKISIKFKLLLIGQRYFNITNKLSYFSDYLSKTVQKNYVIKTDQNINIEDGLYSDLVLFD